MPNNYGSHLGFDDEDYKNLGVSILENEKEIIDQFRYHYPIRITNEDDKLSLLKENQTLVGVIKFLLK